MTRSQSCCSRWLSCSEGSCGARFAKVIRVADSNGLKLPREFALLVKQARLERKNHPHVMKE